MFKFRHLVDGPLLEVGDDPVLEGNINGPSLIAAPDWLEQAPGNYLLYFAHHEGHAIRMAFSDRLQGPWEIFQPHPLSLENSGFAVETPLPSEMDAEALRYIEAGADGDYPHIASPEVWVDDVNRQIRLYYHGRLQNGLQRTRVALSEDGIHFRARDEILGEPYMRVFQHNSWFYGLSMPALLYRSHDGLSGFEAGPRLCDEPIRHHALLNAKDNWYLFWTRVGDTPERILVSPLITDGDWRDWRLGKAEEVHRAQKNWEGADLPPVASTYGAIHGRANQLRDPAIYVENGSVYLLYTFAGEQGIGIGQLSRT